jgi:hypothetical protein
MYTLEIIGMAIHLTERNISFVLLGGQCVLLLLAIPKLRKAALIRKGRLFQRTSAHGQTANDRLLMIVEREIICFQNVVIAMIGWVAMGTAHFIFPANFVIDFAWKVAISVAFFIFLIRWARQRDLIKETVKKIKQGRD